jgi:hypothetical protein
MLEGRKHHTLSLKVPYNATLGDFKLKSPGGVVLLSHNPITGALDARKLSVEGAGCTVLPPLAVTTLNTDTRDGPLWMDDVTANSYSVRHENRPVFSSAAFPTGGGSIVREGTQALLVSTGSQASSATLRIQSEGGDTKLDIREFAGRVTADVSQGHLIDFGPDGPRHIIMLKGSRTWGSNQECVARARPAARLPRLDADYSVELSVSHSGGDLEIRVHDP